ncbi:chymotrypsin-1-like [Odontomachus brunneus]|uniref:chymotrypsin-1-like n=1 Tax=Odontomachus brunneus TaxID=486640 RepID=UPI0013F19B15|nr:chymotrypsin-1-like [Odontomachus brunneus]
MKLAILLVVGVIAKVYGDEPEPIVGGATASPGQFPYQISLRQNGYHICGGTIISNRHIVTAAHCIPSKNQQSTMTVVTGTNHISSGGQEHRIKSIQVHPQYDTRTNRNDIAVITLEQLMTFNQVQKPIPLANADNADGRTRCVLSGWGQLGARQGPPTYLQYVELTTTTLSDCRRVHSNVFEKQLCCFEKHGIGACMGDSGGPLVCNGRLAGIVSWGIPCGVGYPDVFTKAYHYQDWISQCQKMY